MTDEMSELDMVKNAIKNKAAASAKVLRETQLLLPGDKNYTTGLIHGATETFEALALFLEKTSSEELIRQYKGE